MQRALIVAVGFFVGFSVIGLPGLIARGMEPSQPSMFASAGRAVAVPPALGVPTVSLPAERPSPTVAPTDTPAVVVVSAGRAVELLVTPTSTVAPSPPPSPTSTPPPTAIAKLDVAPPPARIAFERPPQVTAREVIVVDGDSGAILHQAQAHKQVAPASTTKIVTAIVALDHASMTDMVTAIYDENELYDSTLMGLKPGDRVSMGDLLYGLMLPSGTDAALAIANEVAGSSARFATLMNEKARAFGLGDSNFVNPHGLDAPRHYTSAYDMVQFARHGMRDPRFQALAAARSKQLRSGARTFEVPNLNRLLGQVPGADGVKIGYTEDAGRTMVASATRNGRRIYVGAFHSSDLVGDGRALLEWAFRNWR